MTNNGLVPVEGVACLCPGTPHSDGDIIRLYPDLPFRGRFVAMSKVSAAPADLAEVNAALFEAYLYHGIAAWSLVDAAGKPEPVSRESIERLIVPNFPLALRIADKCDELYSESLFGPLAARASKSSPTTPPAPSTSASRRRSRRPPKQ